MDSAITLPEFGPLRNGYMLEDAQQLLIDYALIQCGGRRDRTAHMLGMGVRTLHVKLKARRDGMETPAVRRS